MIITDNSLKTMDFFIIKLCLKSDALHPSQTLGIKHFHQHDATVVHKPVNSEMCIAVLQTYSLRVFVSGVQEEADRGAASGRAFAEAAAAGESVPRLTAAATGNQAPGQETAVPLQRPGPGQQRQAGLGQRGDAPRPKQLPPNPPQEAPLFQAAAGPAAAGEPPAPARLQAPPPAALLPRPRQPVPRQPAPARHPDHLHARETRPGPQPRRPDRAEERVDTGGEQAAQCRGRGLESGRCQDEGAETEVQHRK